MGDFIINLIWFVSGIGIAVSSWSIKRTNNQMKNNLNHKKNCEIKTESDDLSNFLKSYRIYFNDEKKWSLIFSTVEGSVQQNILGLIFYAKIVGYIAYDKSSGERESAIKIIKEMFKDVEYPFDTYLIHIAENAFSNRFKKD